jgi:sugar lactone lactonase YvrE
MSFFGLKGECMRAMMTVLSALVLCGLPLAAQMGTIHTIAGGGPAGQTATRAFFNEPSAVAMDAGGNLYVTLAVQEEVVRVSPAGEVSVVAGTGYAGYSGDGGPADRAALNLTNLYSEVIGGLALDGSGHLYISDCANNVVRRVDLTTGVITTVAGNGAAGYAGDGGPATQAELANPQGLATDPAGNLYIADGNNVVRRVDASTGVISTVNGSGGFFLTGGIAVDGGGDVYVAQPARVTEIHPDGSRIGVAGNGATGYTGDGGPATAAEVNNPTALFVDAAGNVLIADSQNNAIRRVDAVTGTITTVAGAGAAGFDGDGGPATAAHLNLNQYATGSLAEDGQGDLFIPDAFNMRVREVSAADGTIRTVAGGGSGDGLAPRATALGFLVSMETDGAGGLLVHEAADGRVRRLDFNASTVSTFAGNGIPLAPNLAPGDGGPATAATLQVSSYGFMAADGDLYIADWRRVQRVDHATGIITTVAGTGSACNGSNLGDGGPATAACLTQASGVLLDSYGNLYVNDRGDFRIRKIDPSGIITTIAGTGVKGTAGDGGPATAAELANPTSISMDDSGNLHLSDGNDVREIDATTGIITTIAGNGTDVFNGESGPATSIALGFNRGLAVDGLGNLFIADVEMNRIRRLDAFTGMLSTVAGSGAAGFALGSFSGDGGLATQATLNSPYALALDGGNLLIGDSANLRVRSVELPPFLGFLPGSLDFGAQPLHTRTRQTITLKNTSPVRRLRLERITIEGAGRQAFRLHDEGCRHDLAPGASCRLTVVFQPRHVGTTSATIHIHSDAIFSASTVPITGSGTRP